MKSKEFITEDISNYLTKEEYNFFKENQVPKELYKTLADIKKECQPFLNAIEDPFNLLRGFPPTSDLSYKKTVRWQNRKPVSSPDWLHSGLNKEFVRRYKFPYRNGMFCTGSEPQARIYGMVFAVYPVGNFEFIWSPKIKDIYNEYDLWQVQSRDPKGFIDHFEFDSYYDKNLNEAVASGNEIMVKCRSYYALNLNSIRANTATSRMVLNAIQEYWMS